MQLQAEHPLMMRIIKWTNPKPCFKGKSHAQVRKRTRRFTQLSFKIRCLALTTLTFYMKYTIAMKSAKRTICIHSKCHRPRVLIKRTLAVLIQKVQQRLSCILLMNRHPLIRSTLFSSSIRRVQSLIEAVVSSLKTQTRLLKSVVSFRMLPITLQCNIHSNQGVLLMVTSTILIQILSHQAWSLKECRVCIVMAIWWGHQLFLRNWTLTHARILIL